MLCEKCKQEHDGTYGSGRFCCVKCARGFSTMRNREEINRKVSQTMKGHKFTEESKLKIGAASKGRVCTLQTRKKLSISMSKLGRSPESLLEVSKRTTIKIMLRLGTVCSHCGWGDAVCDIHHINGKKIPNADAHFNLTYLCPNCHRLAHTGKLPVSEIVNLIDQIGDRWKEYYYG